jgi:hypothetical protein
MSPDNPDTSNAGAWLFRGWIVAGWVLVTAAGVGVLDLVYTEQPVSLLGVVIRLGLLAASVGFLANVYREYRNEESRG